MRAAAKKKPKKATVTKAAAAKSKSRPKHKPREKRAMPSIDKGASEDTKTDKKSGPGATPGTPEKDPKDKPELGAVGEDPNEKKNTPPPHKQPDTPNTIHNRDQDPNHPANRTPAYAGDATPRPVAEGVTVPPEELLTEQEKLAAAGGGDPNAGVGPVTPSAVTTGPVETIEDQGIGPRTPYPTGNPPPPSESVVYSQGIWKGDEDTDPDVPNARKRDPGPGNVVTSKGPMAAPPRRSGE